MSVDPHREQRLPTNAEAPMQRVDTTVRGRSGRFLLRSDRCRWPNGDEGDYTVFDGPGSAMVVPVFADRSTLLVRQWRYPWGECSWEVPAGTLEGAEEPVACASRELVEEAGLRAERLTPLGTVRPHATAAIIQHIFLAQDLTRVRQRRESYERDMITIELPLDEALDAALAGTIRHSGSIVALARAARAVRAVSSG